MKGKDFYVYVHLRQTDGSIFYVGKGRDKRAWSFLQRNKKWHEENNTHGCFVHIAKDNMSEPCALALERIGISAIGLSNLANLRTGARGPNSGWNHSIEARQKIGDFQRGKKRSPESIEKTRAAHLGVKRSEETKARCSASAKLRVRVPHSQETRAKIAASHIGMKPSPEALQKMKGAVRPRGKDSPSYDHTERSLVHADGRVFVGTRAEFKSFFGVHDSCLSGLIKGTRVSVKGWKLKNV